MAGRPPLTAETATAATAGMKTSTNGVIAASRRATKVTASSDTTRMANADSLCDGFTTCRSGIMAAVCRLT